MLYLIKRDILSLTVSSGLDMLVLLVNKIITMHSVQYYKGLRALAALGARCDAMRRGVARCGAVWRSAARSDGLWAIFNAR